MPRWLTWQSGYSGPVNTTMPTPIGRIADQIALMLRGRALRRSR